MVMAGICLLPIGLVVAPAVRASWTAPQLCRQVYQQNRMMAAFVRTYFPEACIAANEVGAISYETRARVIDVVSIAEDRDFVAKVQGVDIALRAGPPDGKFLLSKNWHHVGGWRPAGAGGDWSVQVYAGSRDRLGDARIALADFVRRLPAGLEYWGVGPGSSPASGEASAAGARPARG